MIPTFGSLQCTTCGRMLRTTATKKAFIIYKCERCIKVKEDYEDLLERFNLIVTADIALLELSTKGGTE